MEIIDNNINRILINIKNKDKNNNHNMEKYINARLTKSLDSYNHELNNYLTSMLSYKDTTILKRI